MTSKAWIAVACREHVLRGVTGGFAQVCHGKAEQLQRMSGGDWLVYYSPTEKFGEKTPHRKFTAIGKILPEAPYPSCMTPDFTPWRRNVTFLSCNEAPIEPMLNQLSFIKDKQRWGFPFRRGCFLIPLNDLQFIASHMGIDIL